MKKIRTISVLLAALMLVSLLVSCGNSGDGSNGGTAEIVTATKSELRFNTIEQGKLTAGAFSTVTIYSDNTYMATTVLNTYYSSDGGETFNPTSDIEYVIYGKYEVVNTNDELGERTVKVTSVDRVAIAGTEITDADTLAENSFIGTELILTDSHELSELIDFSNFVDLVDTNPYD